MSPTPEDATHRAPADAEHRLAEGERVAASDAVLAAPLGGEVVLLEPEEAVYYSLNEVGARIWELIQEPATFESICETLLEEFEVERDVCEADARRVLSDLIEHGLAEIHPPAR